MTMSQFPEYSDAELSRYIINHGGVIQQAMIAELNRRQQVRTNEQITSVQSEVSKTRAELDGIRERLNALKSVKRREFVFPSISRIGIVPWRGGGRKALGWWIC